VVHKNTRERNFEMDEEWAHILL